MNFRERQKIIDYLNVFEAEHPTEDWLFGGIKIWPILKTTLFLRLFWGIKANQKQRTKRFELLNSFNHAVKRINSSLRFKKIKLNSTDYLFFGGVNFREKFNGESFNKFYDPIGDKLDEKSKEFLFLEYGEEILEKTYKSRGENIQLIYRYFESKIKMAEIDYSKMVGIEEFKSFIEKKLSNSNFSFYKEIQETLRKIFIWEASFDWILEQTKPRKIFLLSYYNIPCFGLLIAARKQGIQCVDIQHGTQGVLHPAYSGFKEDYSILPTLFWLWDQKTEEQLKENLKFSNFQTKVGGNPWHYFLINKRNELNQKKPSILYTLQPLNPLIDDYLVETILKTKEDFAWLIRLHPRIDTKSRNQLIDRFKSLEIFDKVLWDLANETPLPLLLKEVDLHISKFSGCISEAADLGTFSIILEKNGEITYKHLIEEGIAIGGIELNSENLLDAINSNLGKKKVIDSVDLELVIDQLC